MRPRLGLVVGLFLSIHRYFQFAVISSTGGLIAFSVHTAKQQFKIHNKTFDERIQLFLYSFLNLHSAQLLDSVWFCKWKSNNTTNKRLHFQDVNLQHSVVHIARPRA